jgi:hypothetical protein
MKKGSLPILLAIAILIAASLACGAPATPGVSNMYMSSDEQGATRTTSFTPDQDFFVFFAVNNVAVGTPFQSQWFYLDGDDPNTPFHSIDYAREVGVDTIYFQLTSTDPWPAGNFRVDVYMNGTKVGEQSFSVQ